MRRKQNGVGRTRGGAALTFRFQQVTRCNDDPSVAQQAGDSVGRSGDADVRRRVASQIARLIRTSSPTPTPSLCGRPIIDSAALTVGSWHSSRPGSWTSRIYVAERKTKCQEDWK